MKVRRTPARHAAFNLALLGNVLVALAVGASPAAGLPAERSHPVLQFVTASAGAWASDPPPSAEVRRLSSLTLAARPQPSSPLPRVGDPAPHAAPQGWSTLMTEDFESSFPSGAWSVFDADGAVNGEYFWDEDDHRPHTGSASAWPAKGGANGWDPAANYYTNNMKSWMVYGPFDLSDASDAELLFYYWNHSEASYDWFGWYASRDGLNFQGTRVSGKSELWTYVNFDLTAVPVLGNLAGDSSVWIAFAFTSDSGTMNWGPFVDDIVLQAYSPPRPNLTPYQPAGWDYPVVPASVTGTSTVNALTALGSTYIDWAAANLGAATAAAFTNCLYLDDAPLQCWTTPGLNENASASSLDWPAIITPGPHTLKLAVDVNDDVPESDEGDNTWQLAFTWDESCPPSSYNSQRDAPGAGSPLINDVLPLPESVRHRISLEDAASHAPGRYDNAVFMTGKVAVGILLPESAGSAEDWTSAETSCVVQKIQAGMDWWKNRGGSAAGLSFVYDVQLGVPTSYEPIQQAPNDQGLWIGEALANMGYAGPDYWEQVYSYVSHIKELNDADWAFVFLVADSSNDPDGAFAGGPYFAYTYLGGPFVIMTSDNDGWGLDDMNWVAAHETGHVFRAADQYYQAGYGGCTSATQRYGYLGIPNSNCQYNNPASVPSIMRSNEDALDSSARQQVGWKDSDGDGILDPLDTSPAFSLPPYTPDPTANTTLSYSGSAYDNPWPHALCSPSDHCFNKDITLHAITGVQYRVDNGPWLGGTPLDGSFDSDYEPITFTAGSLADGPHTIDGIAYNSPGRSTSWQDVVTVATPHLLTLGKTGAGTGTVTSSPPGINCGLDCSQEYPWNTTVSLTAAADPGSVFAGWDDPACPGIGKCVLLITAAKNLNASFIPQPPLITEVYRSAAAQDGWVLESGEFSSRGGSINASAAALLLGDDSSDRQYRSILSFNTALLPDNAVVTSVTLKLKQAGLPLGTNPFLTHGNLIVDLRRSPFGASAALQPLDFQAAASKNAAMTITNDPVGGWYTRALGAAHFVYINKAGLTQFRLRFAKGDNDDGGADVLKLYSGNALTLSLRPQLVIKYYLLP